MKQTLAILSAFLLAVLAAHGAKNLLDVRYRSLPADFERVLAEEPDNWSFGFRPYGSGASQLWTDPIVARGALSGAVDANASGPRPTALHVSCDDDSFSLLVLCVEPKINEAIAATNALPRPSIELYFAPGDSDNHDPEPYFQFYYGNGVLRHFQWQVQDRTWRDIQSSVRVDERKVANGYLVRFTFPWEALFDRLPFSDKADAIWRLSVIRWVDGGRTWGGVVHQESRAGYIRFPDFTPEQRAKIMKLLLEKGWSSFQSAQGDAQYSLAGCWAMPVVRTEPYITEAVAAKPRTYINYSEDPAFRPILANLVAERRALAGDIARFESMAPADQLAFYRRASDSLFNFRYFVEEAYARHLEGKLFR